MVFDEDGKAIESKQAKTNNSTAKVITCPNCGVIITTPNDVIVIKVKTRECPRCRTFLGEW